MAELKIAGLFLHSVIYAYGAWRWWKVILKPSVFTPTSSLAATAFAIVVLDHWVAGIMLIIALHWYEKDIR